VASFAERHHGPPRKGYWAMDCLKGNAKPSVLARKFLSIRPQADLVQQALAADSPVSGLYSKLRGRAAEAQRWIACLVLRALNLMHLERGQAALPDLEIH